MATDDGVCSARESRVNCVLVVFELVIVRVFVFKLR